MNSPLALPQLTVVIPSHDRPESVRRVLARLQQQSVAPDSFEIVVVLDGPSSESERIFKQWDSSHSLRWFTQTHAGAPAARNRGLVEARGEIVLFLDDDVIPMPDLLKAHLDAHSKCERSLVFGTFFRSPQSPEPLVQEAADWSDLHRARCGAPGFSPEVQDVADGNLSAPRELLIRVGGWDESFSGVGGSDDTDLAKRWTTAGLRLHCEPRALGEHYWTKSWSDYLRDRRQIGRAHRYLVHKHPECAPELHASRFITGNPGRRALAGATRIAPEFLFDLAFRLISKLPRGWSPGLFRSFFRWMIAVSGAVYYLRGYYEGLLSVQDAPAEHHPERASRIPAG